MVLFLLINVSIAEEMTNHTLDMYLGDSINLRTYMREGNIDFEIDPNTVVQNFNANVVTVNSSYGVKAKDVGTSVLVISNSTQSITLNINVESSIERIEMEQKYITLLLGEIYDLKYTVETKSGGNNPSDLDIEWTSNKPHVAGIVNGDQIYTKAAGDATFTGKAINGEVLVSFNLTVLGHSNDLKIISNDRVRSMNVGESIALTARFGTKDISESVLWESLTPHIVKVDEHGVVTAVGEGRAEIRANSSTKNNNATYTLDTYSMIDKVSLNNSLVNFKAIGQTHQLFFNLYPKDKNNPPILTGYRYVSSNESVATVTNNGLVTAKGPGIALISVIFDDSQKRASCTVEVPESDAIVAANYIEVEKIVLKPYNQTALIGDKIKLDYQIMPENASNTDVTFNVAKGDDKQIQVIDGQYYFIPNKRGNVTIEISTTDGAKDSISMSVTSPIKSIDLSLSTRRKVSLNEEKLYMGERAELLTKTYARTGYSVSDIYPSSLKYSIQNEEIAKLIVDGNRYYIKALKPGKTEIHVENLEGMHDTTLWLSVENPIKGITTDKLVVLPVNKHFRPRVSSDFTSSATNVSDSYNVSDLISLNVKQLYISETFIDQEIAYENLNSDDTSHDDYNKHQERLGQLKNLKAKVIAGYAPIYDVYELKNRSGQYYKFYNIENGMITAYYPCKIDIEIMLANTIYKDDSTLEWVSDPEQFTITRFNSVYNMDTLLGQFSLTSILGTLSKEEQVNLFLTYLNNIELFDEVPSYSVLSSLYVLEKDFTLSAIVKKLQGNITKGDLTKLSVALHKKYIDKNVFMTSEDVGYYYDVVDLELAQAIALQHVLPESNFYFATETIVTENDFDQMVKSVLPSYTFKDATSTKNLTFERLLVLLANLIE